MNLRLLLLVTASLALLAASGCRVLTGSSSCRNPQPYQAAESLPPLRVPAGLQAPDTSGALRIPELNQPEYPRDPDAPCLESPPALTEPPPPAANIVLPSQRDSADEEPRRRRGRARDAGEETAKEEPKEEAKDKSGDRSTRRPSRGPR